MPGAKVTCVELSHDAWPYLTANVAALGGKTTQAERGDVMNYYTQIEPESADLIISNPPYLTAREMQNLMPETAREPAMALDGGADGLDFYRCLLYTSFRPSSSPGAAATGMWRPCCGHRSCRGRAARCKRR